MELDTIVCGDARGEMSRMPEGCVQTCVTSPPYWGLRDYGLDPIVWDGDLECEHEWNNHHQAPRGGKCTQCNPPNTSGNRTMQEMSSLRGEGIDSSFCVLCGAWLGCLGLEPTPELYVDHLVQIFREVKRVLRDDGTLWLNIGDSYATSMFSHDYPRNVTQPQNNWEGTKLESRKSHIGNTVVSRDPSGLKPKDMVLIPFRLALALQEPYETHVIKDERWRMWLAAVIDTDGCMGIRKQASSGKKDRDWNDTYIPYLTVSMSDTQVIEKCIQITGYGKVNVKARAGTSDSRGINSRHDYHTWRLDGDKAVKLLRDIHPYLLIKQRQALAICALDDSNKASRTGRYEGKVPPKEIEKRESLYVLTKALNQREQVDFPSWIPVPAAHIEPGWWVRSDIIWHKPNVMPSSVKDRPTTDYEHVFLLAKSKRYHYDQDAIREPYTEPLNRWGGPTIKEETTKHSKYLDMQNIGASSAMRAGRPIRPNEAGRNKRTVWTIPTKSFSGAHFATFPPDLVEPMILAGSAEGDVVLDPFMGSGTVAEVALKHRRHFIGIEANSEYCELARERIAAEQAQLKLW